jgi:hypothetical protein
VNSPVQRRSLGISDENGHLLARCHAALNMNFVVGPCPAETFFFDQYILDTAYQLRPLIHCDPIDQFQTSLMPFFNDFLR